MTKSIVSISVDRNVLRWVRDKVEERVFASRSHAVEYALTQLMKNDKKREPPYVSS